MNQLFTPEELAELAEFDAMVDASDITPEELRESRMREREEALAGASEQVKKRHIYTKMYYLANRERILSGRKAYYWKNRDAVMERRKRYYDANREMILAYQRAYRNRKKTIDQGGTDNGKDS